MEQPIVSLKYQTINNLRQAMSHNLRMAEMCENALAIKLSQDMAIIANEMCDKFEAAKSDGELHEIAEGLQVAMSSLHDIMGEQQKVMPMLFIDNGFLAARTQAFTAMAVDSSTYTVEKVEAIYREYEENVRAMVYETA